MMTKILSTSVMVILTWWVFREQVSSFMTRKRGLDLISQLPDDVLVFIIARIPTKTAVTTSILSKRWRNLYKSLSTIKLYYTDLMRPYSIACPHTCAFDSMIRSFFLAAGFIKPNDQRFEQRVYYLLEKSNAEKLQLYCNSCCRCPRYIFSCDHVSEVPTLKHLELLRCIPNLESKWKSLTTLSMEECTVFPGFWECILSNCFNLESLIIRDCKCPPKLCIRGPSLQLKTLSIRNSESIEEIELHASNLSEFEYRSSKMANLVFDYVPKLEIIHMYVSCSGQWANMMPCIFGQVAKYVPSLKFLTFATKPNFSQGMLMGRSMLGKLRVLDMTLGWTPKPINLLKLIPYLDSCPILEELQLNLPRVVGEVVGAMNINYEMIEMRKLKKVEINGFRGRDDMIRFAVYILKKAPSLHQMCIIIRYSKKYFGGGKYWRAKPWYEETCENNINQSLHGLAVSPSAKLIILHRF